MVRYHDREWGVPSWNDRVHFEFLILESAQAGLRWSTILNRRSGYRRAFAGFDPVRVAGFSSSHVERLLRNPEIIRNRAKVEAAVNNAARFLQLQAEFGRFSDYIWEFVGREPLVGAWPRDRDVPASTAISDVLAEDMKARGFRFVGSIVLYAHMQATGLVNDHLVGCFRHTQIVVAAEAAKRRIDP